LKRLKPGENDKNCFMAKTHYDVEFATK